MVDSKIFDEKYEALNKKQKEAVDTIYGPVMVVAGPGTGKTTILTLRIANILRKADAKPDEILALTFTEAGARNMRDKLREIIDDTSFRVNIFTFHGFANYIRGIYPENFTKIGERMPASDADKIEVIESILNKQGFRELRVSEFGISIGKVSGRISDLKRELITPESLAQIVGGEEIKIKDEIKSLQKEKVTKTAEKEIERKEKAVRRLAEFAALYELYERELKSRALYDFDDAILELIRALKENGDMRSEVRERFQFILADEHQDANGAQNEILKLFKDEDEVDPPNIFVVGDDKQSIFRFQGASLEHFYNFASEFPGAKKISLEDNYRSQRTILDASHSLISSDGRSHQKLSSNVPHAEKKIEVVEYTDYESELMGVAKEVKAIADKNSGESVAIITRNNQALFDIAEYLKAINVNFKIAGERSLFEDIEYRKLLSLLEALCDPYEGRLLAALYAGYFNAPIHELLRIAGAARRERRDPAELLFAKDSGINEMGEIMDLISRAKKTLVTEMLQGIKDAVYTNSAPAAYDALRAVFDEARKLVVKKRSATLGDLVSHLKFLEKHHLAPLSGEKAVNAKVELLSIHRAKGLEYDYVFIIDATAKRFEGSGKRGDLLAIPGVGIDSQLEEERRLLYVAMTRGKRHVTISYSLAGERGEDNAPTGLLEEIDPKFVDRHVAADIEKIDLLKTPRMDKAAKIEELRVAFLSRSFSVTALNNFIECPWKYLFRNLLLIPDVSEYSANLGNACHNTLRVFHLNTKKGKCMTERELLDLVSQSVHHEPFSQSEIPLALEKAEEYVSAYVKSFVPFTPDEEVYVEEAFSFSYPMVLGGKQASIQITGKIDLARERGGAVSVIDFKTKKRMTANAIKGLTKTDTGNEWRQLQFYKFLFENARPESTVSEGVLTFLSPEKGVPLSEKFTLTNEDKKEIEERLSRVLSSIYDFNFLNETCGEKDCEYCSLSTTFR